MKKFCLSIFFALISALSFSAPMRELKVGQKLYTTEFSNLPHKNGRYYVLRSVQEVDVLEYILYFDVYDNDKKVISDYKFEATIYPDTYFEYVSLYDEIQEAKSYRFRLPGKDYIWVE